jgi:oligoendopeptidase F
MNWIGDLGSVSTLIHELGHSMHSYYSHKANRSLNASYRIFVAEVASTVNEVFLAEHLLKKYADNKDVQKYVLYTLLKDIEGTIFRQPFFAEFEKNIFATHEKGDALSPTYMSNLYLEMSKDYYGSDIKVLDEIKYHLYSVPHFYYNFYVYKYTVGMCSALAIVSRILSGDKKQLADYLKFLSLGGSTWPVDELKVANVDVLSSQLYADAFTYFENLLTRFENLFNE